MTNSGRKAGDTADIRRKLHHARIDQDGTAISEFLGSLPMSDALRGIAVLSPDNRSRALLLFPSEMAARIIEQAPNGLANDLIDGVDLVFCAGCD